MSEQTVTDAGPKSAFLTTSDFTVMADDTGAITLARRLEDGDFRWVTTTVTEAVDKLYPPEEA